MNQLAAGINRLTEVNAISPSEFTPTMSSSTPPFSSVNRIATFSSRFQKFSLVSPNEQELAELTEYEQS